MKFLLMTVFDIKAEMHGPLVQVKARGEGLRQFQVLVNDKNTMPGKFPGDFKLCHIGEYDDLTGKVESHEPITLAIGSDLVAAGQVIPIGVKE